MTSSSSILFTCLFAVLLVQPGVVADPLKDFLAPILAPVMDDVCKMVECGKGKCKPSAAGLSFVCECDDGWKQSLTEDDDVLKFLPCVIPNCTLDYSCASAPSPTPPKRNGTIGSIFDPCNVASCGEGTCNTTSPFTHNCECKQGYSNLLNVTSFPCLKECSIGMDCLRLGIPIANTTPPAGPTLPDKSSGVGSLDQSIYLVIAVMIYYWSLMVMVCR
ncbi:hypothetical protein QQ045_012323 [Rhodiola kirilowii]